MAQVSYLSTKSMDYKDKYTNVRMQREDGIHFWADTPARTSRRGHLWVPGERITLGKKTLNRPAHPLRPRRHVSDALLRLNDQVGVAGMSPSTGSVESDDQQERTVK